MFLTLQKIRSGVQTPIIINSEAILMVESQELKQQNGAPFIATRVEVIGYPHYSFFTLTPVSTLSTYLRTVDLTSGVEVGSECAGTAGVLEVIRPAAVLPLVKAKAVFNASLTEYREYLFNPTFLVYAESVKYGGAGNSAYTGLMISLRDSSMRQILTQMEFNDLSSLLSPVTIPSP